MEWDREKVCLLIDLYRSQRVLWDSADPEFKNRNRKHYAWGIIAATLNIHRKEVECKMRKLIGQFYRECKKGSSSFGTDDANRKWFAYKLLLFLKDKNVPCHYQNNSCTADQQVYVDQDGTTDSLDDVGEETEETMNGSAVGVESPIDYMKRVQPSPNRSQDAVYSTSRNKRKVSYQGAEEGCKTQREPPTRDEYDVFGEYVAHSLRKLKTEHAKLVVKHEISNLLFNGGVGLYDERSQPTSSTTSPLPLPSTEVHIKEEVDIAIE